ncbi:MAG TPA: hypothetical protein VIY73_22800 [Polyangiaceae bacterium]
MPKLGRLGHRTLLVGALLLGAAVAFLGGCHRPEQKPEADAYVPMASPARPGPPDPSVLEIRDGFDFAVTIPARAHACVVYPASLFDEAACPKAARAHSGVPAGLSEKVRLLAVAILQPGGAGGAVQLTVSLQRRDSPPYQPEPAGAYAFADGLMAAIGRTSPDATVRGGAPEIRLLTAHGLPVVRMTYDLDGCTGKQKDLAHMSSYGVMTPQGWYVFTVNAPVDEAEIARALADEMVGTLRVSKLAPRLPRAP